MVEFHGFFLINDDVIQFEGQADSRQKQKNNNTFINALLYMSKKLVNDRNQ